MCGYGFSTHTPLRWLLLHNEVGCLPYKYLPVAIRNSLVHCEWISTPLIENKKMFPNKGGLTVGLCMLHREAEPFLDFFPTSQQSFWPTLGAARGTPFYRPVAAKHTPTSETERGREGRRIDLREEWGEGKETERDSRLDFMFQFKINFGERDLITIIIDVLAICQLHHPLPPPFFSLLIARVYSKGSTQWRHDCTNLLNLGSCHSHS